jgi:phosphonoacetate hydrolase
VSEQRVVVMLVDGFGLEYWDATPLPALKRMAAEGIFHRGWAVFPTLTNANNVSLVTGAWPAEHGVTTNCYFDESAGEARFLEDPAFLLAPTIFDRARGRSVRSALLTCKAKTLRLLGGAADLAISAEAPTEDVREAFGAPPPMYSAEVNDWLLSAALRVLRDRREIGLVYVHTTDFPMHAWSPGSPESQAHLAMVDARIAEMRESAPDATFLVTADHGMNAKSRCLDLAALCAAAGVPLRFAVSPVADRLVRHHRGFGGVSYVYLAQPGDARAVSELLGSVAGVEAVLPRAEAAARFRLMPERIGDLVILPDRDTVFGDLGVPEERLAPDYRNHGSLHEQKIPLLAHGPAAVRLLPEPPRFNLDLTRRLYRPRAAGGCAGSHDGGFDDACAASGGGAPGRLRPGVPGEERHARAEGDGA